MMQRHIERLRRAFWNFKQPLTLRPEVIGVPVSDLFVWRNSEEWETFFELMDIPSLFADCENIPDRHVTIFFFGSNGALLLEKRLGVVPNQRHTLNISALIPKSAWAFGTFCVFHSHTPQVVTELGSYIAERGYVSYRYKAAHLRSYVHGNLDAIALLSNKRLQPLGGSSFRSREYRLQHALRGPALYEVGIVNPTLRLQRFSCRLLSTSSGEILAAQEACVKPQGCHVFLIQVEQTQQGRIVINSHMVMARPLIFRIQGQGMDVFHG